MADVTAADYLFLASLLQVATAFVIHMSLCKHWNYCSLEMLYNKDMDMTRMG